VTDEALRHALRLVYIVDPASARDGDRLDAVLGTGGTALWLRAPGANGAETYRTARDLQTRCQAHGAVLLVGDRADVALAVGARGLQLGFRSPPLKAVRPIFPGWIGISCHSAQDLAAAAEGGADFAVLSPVFGVPDKGRPLGLSVFHRLVDEAPLPVVALGGIDDANVAEVRATGAIGVAVIRALRDAVEPARLARRLGGPMTAR
jgi:thiamine-phosphate pyrophosphorylase